MAQQPVVVQRGPGLIFGKRPAFVAFIVIAVVIFIITAFIHLGDASFKYEASMDWVGFASFAFAFLFF